VKSVTAGCPRLCDADRGVSTTTQTWYLVEGMAPSSEDFYRVRAVPPMTRSSSRLRSAAHVRTGLRRKTWAIPGRPRWSCVRPTRRTRSSGAPRTVLQRAKSRQPLGIRVCAQPGGGPVRIEVTDGLGAPLGSLETRVFSSPGVALDRSVPRDVIDLTALGFWWPRAFPWAFESSLREPPEPILLVPRNRGRVRRRPRASRRPTSCRHLAFRVLVR